MIKRLGILILLWSAAAVGLAHAESVAQGAEVRQLVSEALENNAALRADESRWKMFSHKVAPAESLSDPRLSFGMSSYPVNSLASDETPMTGNDLRIEQAFPFPGKLSLKGEVAEQQAAWYRAAYLDRRLDVAFQVSDQWYALYGLEKELQLLRANLEAVEQLILLTETRYTVGKGTQQDVLNAQLRRSQLMEREFTTEQRRQATQAALLALLNRESPEPVSAADELPEALELPDLDTALNSLEQSRPIFKAYQALVSQYLAQKGLAEKDFYPDLGMWASYRFRDDNLPDGGEDFVSAGVSINLPIYRTKRHARVADAEAGVAMARHQYQQLRNQTVSSLKESSARLVQTRDQVLLFRSGIIPQAQQSFDAGLRAYQVGKISFKELIDSLMALYDYQIKYHRALADFYRTRARFEQLAGLSLYDDSRQEDNRK